MNMGGAHGRSHRNDDRLEMADLNALTVLVLRVFSEVLGLDDVAEDDDFFDACGGTSVQAWWVVTEIAALTGTTIELKEFLKSANARDTAALLYAPPLTHAP